jgi:hypothetical protein
MLVIAPPFRRPPPHDCGDDDLVERREQQDEQEPFEPGSESQSQAESGAYRCYTGWGTPLAAQPPVGGAADAQSLCRLGLVDEYRLVLQPVALGNGLPLFKGLTAPLRLELVDAQTYNTGSALHVYRPARPTS